MDPNPDGEPEENEHPRINKKELVRWGGYVVAYILGHYILGYLLKQLNIKSGNIGVC